MELEFEVYSNIEDVSRYTQTIENNNELCIICQLDEIEDGKQWDRYKLVCGHIFHTRCFRTWAGRKESINCPYCGDIEMCEKNKYCSDCKKFGHSNYDTYCPNDKNEAFQRAIQEAKQRKNKKHLSLSEIRKISQKIYLTPKI
jgi:hypothetical protein